MGWTVGNTENLKSVRRSITNKQGWSKAEKGDTIFYWGWRIPCQMIS